MMCYDQRKTLLYAATAKISYAVPNEPCARLLFAVICQAIADLTVPCSAERLKRHYDTDFGEVSDSSIMYQSAEQAEDSFYANSLKVPAYCTAVIFVYGGGMANYCEYIGISYTYAMGVIKKTLGHVGYSIVPERFADGYREYVGI